MSERDDFDALMGATFDNDAEQVGDDDYIPTRAEDLETMRRKLIELGAGEKALVGTVVNTDNGGAFTAIYGVTEQPPAVVQIALTSGNYYAVTKVAVDANDDPIIDFGRGINHVSDPQLLYDMNTQMGDEGLGRIGGDAADMMFTNAFYNVEGFTPNPES